MRARAPDTAVLCVGRLYCDLIFTGAPRLPTLGTEVFAEGLSLHAGGGAFITAAYLAALGRNASLAATLPARPFSALVTQDIAAAGVGAGFCAPAAEGAEPQITVAMVGDGDRAFLTRRSGPAFPALGAEQLRASGAGHLHIGELATLAEHPDLLEIARAAGMTVSLDCGWDDAIGAEAGPLIAGVDVFLPNEAEAARLHDLGLPDPPAPLTVIKCGAKGARAIAGGQAETAPARDVSVVDTTGAGDAFNSGFLHAWLQGQSLGRSLAAGNDCGARAVGRRGGLGGLSSLQGKARPAPARVVR